MTAPGGFGGSILRFGPLDEAAGLRTLEDREYHREAGRRFLATAADCEARARSPEPGAVVSPDELRAIARKARADGEAMLERADRVAAAMGADR